MKNNYNPYDTQAGTVNGQLRINAQGQSGACLAQLDHVTRSRNALIISLIVFVIAFLACFIALIVLMPKYTPTTTSSTITTQTTATLQVVSYLPNTPYDVSLSDSNNYAFSLLNVTVCGNIVDAAKSVSTVVSCDTKTFEDNSGKVKATNQLMVELDGKTEAVRFTDVSAAIVAAAATNTDWDVTDADVTIVPYVPPSSAIRLSVQILPLLLPFLVLDLVK